jgi:hypothetical protein
LPAEADRLTGSPQPVSATPPPASDSNSIGSIFVRPKLNSHLAVFFLGFLLGVFSANPCCGQAPIDPSLPEAPLPHKRALLLFPGYDVMQQTTDPVAPLRTSQKFEMAYRSTFDPSFLMRSAIVTVFDKALGVGPDYGGGGSGIAQLYGYNTASLASTFFFAQAAVPAVFHQDPRYFRKGTGSAKSRIWWAFRSEFVGFSDRGPQMPNYGVLIGFGLSTLLSDAYLPARNVSVGKSFQGYGFKIGTNFGLNVLHEYGGVTRVKKILEQQTQKLSMLGPH